MANEEHVSLLRQGVDAWNAWREKNRDIRPDLSGANLKDADLRKADLKEANLKRTDLDRANLFGADLRKANLHKANLHKANLVAAILNEADFAGADLTGCRIYGASAWGMKNVEEAKQQNLVITRKDEPEITVDNIEVAQFIYLLLHNEKIRDVIDTITTKAVLILGRFTPKRKKVLDKLREELRKRDRTPIVFDFDQPENKNVTDTVKLLAQMVRYIIVDLSDPNSAPYELGVISTLGLKRTPVVPIIVEGQRPFSMLEDVLEEPWCTKLIEYKDMENLTRLYLHHGGLANLDERVVKIAEEKVQALIRRGEDKADFEPPETEATKALSLIFPAGPTRALSPAAPVGASPVDAAVFCPPRVPKDSTFLVQVCLYSSGDEDKAIARAREADAKAERRGTYSLPLDIPPNTRVDLHLEMPGLKVEEPDAVLIWRGRPTIAQFEVGVPTTMSDTEVIGRVRFAIAGVPAGTLRFKVDLDAPGAAAAPTTAREAEPKRYHRAFTSYSSEDKAEVLRRVQAFKIAGLSVFQDILDLGPGERWERALYREIDNCDVFLLFWSKAAAASEWVAKEIAYALERKAGSDDKPPDIQPVPIEGPPPPHPPKTLRHLHFNDALLAHIQAAIASAQSVDRQGA
jgi:hypothetical protein